MKLCKANFKENTLTAGRIKKNLDNVKLNEFHFEEKGGKRGSNFSIEETLVHEGVFERRNGDIFYKVPSKKIMVRGSFGEDHPFEMWIPPLLFVITFGRDFYVISDNRYIMPLSNIFHGGDTFNRSSCPEGEFVKRRACVGNAFRYLVEEYGSEELFNNHPDKVVNTFLSSHVNSDLSFLNNFYRNSFSLNCTELRSVLLLYSKFSEQFDNADDYLRESLRIQKKANNGSKSVIEIIKEEMGVSGSFTEGNLDL